MGLMTGDVSINPNAACVVMTTEILRSMLYRCGFCSTALCTSDKLLHGWDTLQMRGTAMPISSRQRTSGNCVLLANSRGSELL